MFPLLILTLFTDMAIAEPPPLDWNLICQYAPFTDQDIHAIFNDGYTRTIPTAADVNEICAA